MNLDDIRARIKQGIADVATIDPNEIQDSSSYVEDLGLDSLSILEIVVLLEQHYKIKMPPEQLAEIRTVGDTIAVVQKYLGAIPLDEPSSATA
jgi:acyl carrier protein